MANKSQEFIQTAIRIPKAWLERLDRLAKKTSTPGGRATRSDMHRDALYLGIASLESKGGKK